MKLNNEIKIGMLVTIVVVALLWLTIQVGDFNFSNKGYELKVHFYGIEGLEDEAPVRLNGFEVGAVKDIRIVYDDNETYMELTIWLEEDARIREGAKARVKTMGFLGDKYLDLSAGDKNAPFLQPGSIIVGQEPVDFEEILQEGQVIAKNLKEITDNINERLRVNSAAIDEIVVNLNVSMKNIAAISDNVNERLVVNKNKIDDIVGNLNTTTQNLEELSEDLKLNPWKLLYKEKTRKKKE